VFLLMPCEYELGRARNRETLRGILASRVFTCATVHAGVGVCVFVHAVVYARVGL
jgi:hypothetical protein